MSTREKEPVDREATEALAGAFFAAIKSHYLLRPTSRGSAHEVLNALAATTAIILKGCDNDPDARKFFDAALKQNIAGNMEG